MKRHLDAIAINLGACNPSGIAHSIIEAQAEIYEQPDHTGTRSVTHDPAVQLMVHQLAFICGLVVDFPDFDAYSKAVDVCKKHIKIKDPKNVLLTIS